jgi:hypothetical protein
MPVVEAQILRGATGVSGEVAANGRSAEGCSEVLGRPSPEADNSADAPVRLTRRTGRRAGLQPATPAADAWEPSEHASTAHTAQEANPAAIATTTTHVSKRNMSQRVMSDLIVCQSIVANQQSVPSIVAESVVGARLGTPGVLGNGHSAGPLRARLNTHEGRRVRESRQT